MQPDALDALAGQVAQAIHGALAPVLADVKTLQALVSGWEARWGDLGALRERVAVVEAKGSAAPVVAPVDIAPLVERVAAAEGRISSIGDLRDRLIMVETKAVAPALAAEGSLMDLRARVALLEAKGPTETPGELAAVRERLAVLETRAPVAGPAGKDGANGVDGVDGKDGADGLGFDDLAVEFDGERTIAVKFQRGAEVKSFPIVLPFLKYQGVFSEGKTYTPGDVVTWAGSTWSCSEATSSKPGEGSKAWTLAVKRGRDGKDGAVGAQGPQGRAGLDWDAGRRA